MIYLIRAYQTYVSAGRAPCCRYTPSCSQYAVEAIQVHGSFRGFFLAFWRILRCNPFSKGGYDPVPPPREKRTRAEDEKQMGKKH